MNVEKKYIKDAQNEDSSEIDIFKSIESGLVSYKNRYGIAIPLESTGTPDFKNVYDNLIANNTNSNTTAVLNYGVNVFTTVTATNYAAKLPQPKTGRGTVIVNNSTSSITLYPSNIGGKINNYAINVPAIIPADGKAYIFYCIENPLPGAWTWNAPATSQIVLGEISINHTQGTPSGGYGYTTANLGPVLSSVYNAGTGNMVLTGSWLTENVPTSLITMKTYTNILATDLASTSVMDQVSVELYQTYKNSATSVKFAQEVQQYFRGNTPNLFVNGGALNSPVQVGDVNTMYMTTVPFNGNNGFTDQLGLGGQFSRAYYTFALGISASAITKVYKFQIILEVSQ